MLRATAICLVSVAINSSAAAQDRSPYVGVGGMVSTQGSHRPGQSPSFPRSGVEAALVAGPSVVREDTLQRIALQPGSSGGVVIGSSARSKARVTADSSV